MDARKEATDTTEERLLVVLCLLGAWTIAVPYAGPAIGLDVHLASRVEIADHVVPGSLVIAVALWLLAISRRRAAPPAWAQLVGGGICFLAGFWVLATHVGLIVDAARGSVRWAAALWHASTALPIVVVSLWFVLRSPAGSAR